jgi:hypothetical protein
MGNCRLSLGKLPFQDFSQLQRMRDALVHSRPETLKTVNVPLAPDLETQHQPETHDRAKFLIQEGHC